VKHDDEVTVELPETVPVFPLPNTVLFPRTVLPLHIFEPRYRLMLADCLAADERFGLLPPARDGSPPRPGTVGCIARKTVMPAA